MTKLQRVSRNPREMLKVKCQRHSLPDTLGLTLHKLIRGTSQVCTYSLCLTDLALNVGLLQSCYSEGK